MKEFPIFLKPENKDDFLRHKYESHVSYMRKEIFELILGCNENNYFEIDTFGKRHGISKSFLDKMCKNITEELRNLGWNVTTSFGGTGLFIYSTPEPPKSCYKDEF